MIGKTLRRFLSKAANADTRSTCQLARDAGVSRDVVRNAREGNRDMLLKTAQRLANAVGVRLHGELGAGELPDRLAQELLCDMRSLPAIARDGGVDVHALYALVNGGPLPMLSTAERLMVELKIAMPKVNGQPLGNGWLEQ